jgi:hypothetical protein
MRKLVILGIIACVGLLAGSTALIGGPAGPPGGLKVKVVNPLPLPVTGTVNDSTVYRFVGYSHGTTTGDAGGPIGMHSICQASFGLDARMCTTEEFWKTPPRRTTLEDSTRGWIQPVIIATYFDPTGPEGSQQIYVEYSGIRARAENGSAPTRYFSCGQWSNDNVQGLTVTSSGRVGTGDCTPEDGPQHVSCCRPARIGP